MTLTSELSSPKGAERAPRTALLLLLLAILHLVFSWFVNPPGYLTYDSGTYHLMAKTFADTGSFIVWNGYEEHPSQELRVAQLRVAGGRLVSQYPEFLSVLVYPLYLALGYQGLLLLNALAFLATNFLIFRLAVGLYGSARIGYFGMLVYSFATYAWEYSQSSYPHLSSTSFILAAYTLLATALATENPRQAAWSGAAAGLFAGFAVGLRLDAAFAIPGLFLISLLSRPLRVGRITALLAGLVPGVLFLSLSNKLKFDTLSPLSYGIHADTATGSLRFYLPVTILGALAVLFLLAVRRLRGEHRARAWWLVAAGLLVAVAVFPATAWRFVSQLADGTYQILVDMRIRDFDIPEPALMRTRGGAMVYLGGVKKSLLQSCPYLAIVPFLALDAARGRERLRNLVLLTIVPASFLGYYGYLAWHGSVALNMRYLNPILPFTSILAARAWSGMAHRVSRPFAALYTVLVFAACLLAFSTLRLRLFQQELWFLTMPLLLALAIVVFEALRRLGRLPSLGGPVVCYLLLTAFAWSGAVAFGRDYPTSARVRGANLAAAEALRPFIADDSLIVSDALDACWGLLDEVERLRIARGGEDQYRSFRELVRYHLTRGRKVYLVYNPGHYRAVARRGHLAEFDVSVLHLWTTGGIVRLMLLELGVKPTP